MSTTSSLRSGLDTSGNRAGSQTSDSRSTQDRVAEPEERKLPARHVATGVDLFLQSGSVAEHPAIHRFLMSSSRDPGAAEFYAQLEDPFYEPTDRVLIKSRHELIAHAWLSRRDMRFGGQLIPVSGLEQFAVLPEFKERGINDALLEAAEQKIAMDGAVLGIASVEGPLQAFQQQAWSVLSNHQPWTAPPRRILSMLKHLDSPEGDGLPGDLPTEAPHYNIRLWRHFEKVALMRLYAGSVANAFGPLERNEAFWQWLIDRRSYDRIYVAINGPDRMDLDESLDAIVAYAVVREHRVLECFAHPDHPEAQRQLLVRASKDAIERDYHLLEWNGSPTCELFRSVASQDRLEKEPRPFAVPVAKILNPVKMLELLAPHYHQRAEDVGVDRPCEIGLQSDSLKVRLLFSRRTVKVDEGKLGRSYLSMEPSTLNELVLGYRSAAELIAADQIRTSTRIAQDLAENLFPTLPVWRPPWDHAPAIGNDLE